MMNQDTFTTPLSPNSYLAHLEEHRAIVSQLPQPRSLPSPKVNTTLKHQIEEAVRKAKDPSDGRWTKVSRLVKMPCTRGHYRWTGLMAEEMEEEEMRMDSGLFEFSQMQTQARVDCQNRKIALQAPEPVPAQVEKVITPPPIGLTSTTEAEWEAWEKEERRKANEERVMQKIEQWRRVIPSPLDVDEDDDEDDHSMASEVPEPSSSIPVPFTQVDSIPILQDTQPLVTRDSLPQLDTTGTTKINSPLKPEPTFVVSSSPAPQFKPIQQSLTLTSSELLARAPPLGFPVVKKGVNQLNGKPKASGSKETVVPNSSRDFAFEPQEDDGSREVIVISDDEDDEVSKVTETLKTVKEESQQTTAAKGKAKEAHIVDNDCSSPARDELPMNATRSTRASASSSNASKPPSPNSAEQSKPPSKSKSKSKSPPAHNPPNANPSTSTPSERHTPSPPSKASKPPSQSNEKANEKERESGNRSEVDADMEISFLPPSFECSQLVTSTPNPRSRSASAGQDERENGEEKGPEIIPPVSISVSVSHVTSAEQQQQQVGRGAGTPQFEHPSSPPPPALPTPSLSPPPHSTAAQEHSPYQLKTSTQLPRNSSSPAPPAGSNPFTLSSPPPPIPVHPAEDEHIQRTSTQLPRSSPAPPTSSNPFKLSSPPPPIQIPSEHEHEDISSPAPVSTGVEMSSPMPSSPCVRSRARQGRAKRLREPSPSPSPSSPSTAKADDVDCERAAKRPRIESDAPVTPTEEGGGKRLKAMPTLTELLASSKGKKRKGRELVRTPSTLRKVVRESSAASERGGSEKEKMKEKEKEVVRMDLVSEVDVEVMEVEVEVEAVEVPIEKASEKAPAPAPTSPKTKKMMGVSDLAKRFKSTSTTTTTTTTTSVMETRGKFKPATSESQTKGKEKVNGSTREQLVMHDTLAKGKFKAPLPVAGSKGVPDAEVEKSSSSSTSKITKPASNSKKFKPSVPGALVFEPVQEERATTAVKPPSTGRTRSNSKTKALDMVPESAPGKPSSSSRRFKPAVSAVEEDTPAPAVAKPASSSRKFKPAPVAEESSLSSIAESTPPSSAPAAKPASSSKKFKPAPGPAVNSSLSSVDAPAPAAVKPASSSKKFKPVLPPPPPQSSLSSIAESSSSPARAPIAAAMKPNSASKKFKPAPPAPQSSLSSIAEASTPARAPARSSSPIVLAPSSELQLSPEIPSSEPQPSAEAEAAPRMSSPDQASSPDMPISPVTPKPILNTSKGKIFPSPPPPPAFVPVKVAAPAPAELPLMHPNDYFAGVGMDDPTYFPDSLSSNDDLFSIDELRPDLHPQEKEQHDPYAKLTGMEYDTSSPTKSLSSLAESDDEDDMEEEESSSFKGYKGIETQALEMANQSSQGFHPPYASTQNGLLGGGKFGWMGYSSQVEVDHAVHEVDKLLEKDVDYDGWLNLRDHSPDP